MVSAPRYRFRVCATPIVCRLSRSLVRFFPPALAPVVGSNSVAITRLPEQPKLRQPMSIMVLKILVLLCGWVLLGWVSFDRGRFLNKLLIDGNPTCSRRVYSTVEHANKGLAPPE